ncbi:MBL fold metallo-hydrolase [Paenibacillus qinlingensis]|uniref:Glyoxylase-like metal-dependent hydrolase (Beta-lactamase superfamily II) n=1 Tax=Paenibacillus qinlingensis TaxID=1837343 RepID=A0ABU1NZI5_9BACL|nr:MBL fold metallo-hydrolase [Paenibacillus qinlingensis]MDR6552886.1 glyoxylase-like metal-dependent hydrolase (beta-lactamase superfamily II) [Paenibacillus qinlingensis]
MEHHQFGDMEDTMANHYIPMTSVRSGEGEQVSLDLFCYTNQIVNISMVGTAEYWVLVDTGMPQSAKRILKVVEDRFGAGSKPKAIILTHGHFDHVGGVIDLVEAWNVMVYAHELEIPYLTGQASYPEPDGSVEGGLIAKISPFFPNEPINLGSHVHTLPSNGSIPGMPEWRWIHTPGHTPGHVSLFRDKDRALIAGDAFVTVEQDSLYKVLTQKKQLTGPPVYFTTDWHAAELSVRKLVTLQPSVAITGHGVPMSDEELTCGLSQLVSDFKRIAVPDHGRYVDNKIH